ncbi:hypothetical protein PUN28_014856 [Cardiocondyla obscurior]|uniref:Uncharacterized protein n=1 Tax=Cardiocondyla obscurior TaxID=286306 RepID=A0AAW2EX14_9HYME
MSVGLRDTSCVSCIGGATSRNTGKGYCAVAAITLYQWRTNPTSGRHLERRKRPRKGISCTSGATPGLAAVHR